MPCISWLRRKSSKSNDRLLSDLTKQQNAIMLSYFFKTKFKAEVDVQSHAFRRNRCKCPKKRIPQECILSCSEWKNKNSKSFKNREWWLFRIFNDQFIEIALMERPLNYRPSKRTIIKIVDWRLRTWYKAFKSAQWNHSELC